MKLKLTTLSALIALGITTQAYAASNIYPVGANLGYGDASNKNTAFHISANPAWVSSNLDQGNDYGLGITGGFMVTQKGADQLINQYRDKIGPILQQMRNTNNNALTLAQDLKTQMNSLVLSIRDKFHTQIDTQFALPLQISHNAVGGFGLEVSGLAQGKERLLSSNRPLELDTNYLLTNPTAQQQEIVDNGLIIQSAFYTKTAQYAEGALTYGNQFYSNDKGVLSIGMRVKYMQAKLRKSVNDLGGLLRSSSSAGSKVSNDISNTLGSGNFETAMGIDVGFMWLNPHWQVGLNLQNLNSPTFHYNTLGTGPITDDQANIERFYSNQINLQEQVELKAQARIEGAVYTQNKHWVLAASADLNESNDLLNNPYQWASISASYSSSATGDAWWYALIPDVRIGYRTNLTGDNQSFITPGFSWGPLNLDIAFHQFSDLSNVSENNVPQGLALNLGLELQF